MVAVGEKAPEFLGTTDEGKPLALVALRGKKLFLYFYPEADTPGCTVESKGLNERLARLAAKGIQVVGVSTDSVQKQCDFKEKYGFKFPLLADHEKSISKQYGVLGPSGRDKRVSFLIDEKGSVLRVIEGNATVQLAAADELLAS